MTNAPNDHEEPAEIDHHVLQEGHRERRRGRVAAEPHQRVAGHQRNHAFDEQPQLAGEAAMALFCHLQIIVIEADEAEAERHRQHDPDIGVQRIGPQQRRDDEAGENHQPAHRRRALLGDQVRRRPVGADRLALALPQPQMVDDPRAEQEHEQRARHHRPAGAERDVAKHVEGAAEDAKTGNGVGKFDQPVKHSVRPYHAAWLRRLWREARRQRLRSGCALIIVFILKPSKSWPCRGIDESPHAETTAVKCGQFTPLPARRPAAGAQTCSPRTSFCCP